MAKKNYYRNLDFKTPEEYFQYIIDSKINGNYSQVAALIKDMPRKSIGNFIKWVQNNNGDPSGAGRYCQSLAIDILAGSD